MISVVVDKKYSGQVNSNQVRKAAQAALKQQDKKQSGSISIAITGEPEIQKLNLKYLQVDHPTDVLSFPAYETDPETGEKYLGDIIVSYPQVVRQAVEFGRSASEELDFLVIHGVLHLLGFDHADDQTKADMWALQVSILETLKLKH